MVLSKVRVPVGEAHGMRVMGYSCKWLGAVRTDICKLQGYDLHVIEGGFLARLSHNG